MANQGGALSHIILIGHGRGDALQLMNGGWLPVQDFGAAVLTPMSPRTVVSLACETGKTAFGRTMSAMSGCRSYIGPQKAVHGAAASLYVQLLLHLHLLGGTEFHAAARRANGATEGSLFKHWRNGEAL